VVLLYGTTVLADKVCMEDAVPDRHLVEASPTASPRRLAAAYLVDLDPVQEINHGRESKPEKKQL
jgi:hypothetical protein